MIGEAMEYRSFNASELLAQFSGDEEILVEMITLFLESWPEILGPIRESFETHDMEKLRINAHTMKGILNNFFAKKGAAFAYELEKCGARAELSGVYELLNALENELTIFFYEIVQLKKTITPCLQARP